MFAFLNPNSRQVFSNSFQTLSGTNPFFRTNLIIYDSYKTQDSELLHNFDLKTISTLLHFYSNSILSVVGEYYQDVIL